MLIGMRAGGSAVAYACSSGYKGAKLNGKYIRRIDNFGKQKNNMSTVQEKTL